jgi:hypothetical protein
MRSRRGSTPRRAMMDEQGFTNVRRVFVDNSTTPVTFWVGNNHAASIVKLEPIDRAAHTASR